MGPEQCRAGWAKAELPSVLVPGSLWALHRERLHHGQLRNAVESQVAPEGVTAAQHTKNPYRLNMALPAAVEI